MDVMSYDTVLISGVGIAGPTLAFWLRRGGFEPLLLECAPGLRSGGYVIDFWGLGYDIAERMDLAHQSSGSAITCANCALSMKAVGG
jgi:2-polyprenyl-6-methoxyphenol hydroxylase-like FAD-dependent oxidoreductase